MSGHIESAGMPPALQWRLSSSLSRVEINESFDIVLTVQNLGPRPAAATFHLHPPLAAIPRRPRQIEIGELAAGESRSLSFSFRLSQGGRALFWAWEGDEPVPDRRQSCCVLAAGAGYYSGDTHNHSTWSDGKSTLAENRLSLLAKGHSFLYSTDHNTLEHAREIAELAKADEVLAFCHEAGWEFTTSFGHALAYGLREIRSPQSITSRGNLAEWQAFVDDAAARGAIVYLAHPFEAPKYEFGDEVLYGLRGLTGIEVWNGFNHHALHEPNRRAFDAWDNLNSRGDRHYYGNAVSDAHAALRQGDPYIKGWMEKPSLQEVHRLLATGAFFGSNGPDVDFAIGEARIGGVHVLPKEAKAGVALFRLRAFDPFGRLERVTLYRNAIHPEGLPRHRREIAYEADGFTGEERSLFERELELPVMPGQFYRLEVRSRYGASGEGGRGTGQGTGFAYTNPIWIA